MKPNPKSLDLIIKYLSRRKDQKKIEHKVFFSGNDISVGKVADFIQKGGLFTPGNKTTSTAKKMLGNIKRPFLK